MMNYFAISSIVSLIVFARFSLCNEFEYDKLMLYRDDDEPSYFPRVLIYRLNRHMDEFCAKLSSECWCGMIEGYNQYNQGVPKNPRVLEDLSIICQSKPIIVLQKPLDKKSQANLLIEQIDQIENQTEEVVSSENNWTSISQGEFNKHTASLCPPYFNWCFCSYVRDLNKYMRTGAIRNRRTKTTKIVIDCRPYEMRPHEKRDCSQKQSSFLIRLFKSSNKFPCGQYRDLGN